MLAPTTHDARRVAKVPANLTYPIPEATPTIQGQIALGAGEQGKSTGTLQAKESDSILAIENSERLTIPHRPLGSLPVRGEFKSMSVVKRSTNLGFCEAKIERQQTYRLLKSGQLFAIPS